MLPPSRTFSLVRSLWSPYYLSNLVQHPSIVFHTDVCHIACPMPDTSWLVYVITSTLTCILCSHEFILGEEDSCLCGIMAVRNGIFKQYANSPEGERPMVFDSTARQWNLNIFHNWPYCCVSMTNHLGVERSDIHPIINIVSLWSIICFTLQWISM